MHGCKVKLERPLIRSDIATATWHALTREYISIGQSQLQVTEDSVLIVVKDWNHATKVLQIGEDNELIAKYASARYIDYSLTLMQRRAATGASSQIRDTSSHAYEDSKIGDDAGRTSTGDKLIHSSLQDFADVTGTDK